jgi:DNA-binding NarL/FixJ family response regulator
MRALVIDDEQMMLDGLDAFLQASMPELTLDKTAEIDAAVRLAKTVEYSFVVLDWNLLGSDGLPVDASGVIKALRNAHPMVPVIVVSGDDCTDWPKRLLDFELSGFVPKSAHGAVLMDAIHVALRGGIYLPSKALLQHTHCPSRRAAVARRTADPQVLFPELTERQSQVFKVMITGVGDKQIARELGIAESTVKTHVKAILAIVGVRRRGEAVHQVTGARHA